MIVFVVVIIDIVEIVWMAYVCTVSHVTVQLTSRVLVDEIHQATRCYGFFKYESRLVLQSDIFFALFQAHSALGNVALRPYLIVDYNGCRILLCVFKRDAKSLSN